MAIKDALLPEFDHEMAQLRVALERCEKAHFGFKPHEKSWTLGQLAKHLANVPMWAQMTMTTDELDFATFPAPKYEEPASTAVILEEFDGNVKAARAELEKAADEAMMRTWTGRTGDQIHFAMPKAAILRTFVMNHMIHHRGQLTVYLRLTGAKVPALYGPSADEGNM